MTLPRCGSARAAGLALIGTAWILAASGCADPDPPARPTEPAPAEPATATPTPTRPVATAGYNVLFIAIDDLNDWIGCLGGHPDAQTPNLDRLADRGVLFTRAYTTAPACNPARTSVLTGWHPTTTGVYSNDQPWRNVLPGARTLPQAFMAGGYRALGAGKIFHGAYPDPASWHEHLDPGSDPVPDGHPLNGLRDTGHFDWGPIDVDEDRMPDAVVAEWVGARLRRPSDGPFFLACGFYRPHLPWYAPRSYFDLYDPLQIELPLINDMDLTDIPRAGRNLARSDTDHRAVVESNTLRSAVQSYLACVSFVDACVGRVLDALEAGPHADRTIVVLWSDHGWHLGEKMHWRKFALWEEATRVPLIISVPGLTPDGARCEQPVSLMDLYPTLVELCGLPPRDDLDGISLAPLLTEPTTTTDRAVVTTLREGSHAVRDARWRYIRYHDGTEELYDHTWDPQEWTNLARDPEYDEVKRGLAAPLP